MMISEQETVKAWDRPLKRGETLDLFVWENGIPLLISS